VATTSPLTIQDVLNNVERASVTAAVRPIQALVSAPILIFLGTLGVMLFRPPDVQFYSLDRFAFLLLVVGVTLRVCLLRRRPSLGTRAAVPMGLLLLLTTISVLSQPYDTQTWCLFAAKFIVPYSLFHLAMLLFDNPDALRKFETFSLIVLAYLVLVSVAFLVGMKAVIFPRFILDESLGIHADRARGPFLQAVANGVTLNMLGLIALNAFRRRRLRGWRAATLLIALPVAILATLTRAVWISFALSVLGLLFFSQSRRLRQACMGMVIAGVLGLGAALTLGMASTLHDRTEERGPVEIRIGVYKAGWKMFTERPLSGWGINQMPAELAKRMTDYHLKVFWVHNTYLEILVEHGIAGLALYAWIIVELFRVGRRRRGVQSLKESFLDDKFRRVWPLILGAYLLNATFVVMNYQFVNGLLFTLAGMLAGQNKRAEELDGIGG
jgi:O-antigen ligase